MDQKRRYIFLWMFIASGVFILISGLVLTLLDRPFSTPDIAIPTSVEQVMRVSLPDAKAAFDAGTAVFVDVRDSSSFEEAHIPGALLTPLSDLTDQLDKLDPASWIITYCT